VSYNDTIQTTHTIQTTQYACRESTSILTCLFSYRYCKLKLVLTVSSQTAAAA